MKTVAFHNLGCKVNSYELDIMQQILQEEGYKIVPFDQIADIYVINTCTVTNIADRKSRQMLHRAKQKNPKAVVVAVGCYVQTDPKGIEKDPCIDLAIGNNKKKEIAAVLKEFLSQCSDKNDQEAGHDGISVQMQAEDRNTALCNTGSRNAADKTLGGRSVIDIAQEHEYEEFRLRRTAEHTRAYIKIQDGCNQFCSYCAIPLARGRVRSREAENILQEIRGIVEAGYHEIVLTGIHISSYGIDTEKGDYKGSGKLLELIEMIHEIPGLERIRISSLEPRIVTEEAARRLAALPKVCPHFHLSLQSGCDATLKRMNRHYTTEEYSRSVQALRDAYAPSVPAITTDVIVGFPGETQEEFEICKAFLQKICFYEMHVFKYSKRAGTRAAVMPDQVPEEVKAKRSDELLALKKEQSEQFRRRLLGRRVEVLFEEKKMIRGKKYLLGHTRDYVKIALERSDDKTGPQANDIRMLEITEQLTEDVLLGHETDLF